MRFQAAIGAFVGFSGVIIDLVANASLARRAEQRKLDHEKASMVAGLLGELRLITEGVRNNAEKLSGLRERPHKALVVPGKSPGVRAYPALVGRLGLLGADAVELIAAAYQVYDEMPSRLRTLVSAQPHLGSSDQDIVIPSEDAEEAANILRVTCGHMTRALDALRREVTAVKRGSVLPCRRPAAPPPG